MRIDMMRTNLVRTTAPIFALICGAGVALAQQQPPAAQPAPQGAFVNGALTAPGAPANTDTVPAKFSAKNAADDQQPIAAYTFKSLTDEQRRAIVQALKRTPAAPGAPKLKAEVGQVIPRAFELPAVPDDVAAKVPHAKGYHYAATDNGVVLISPTSRFVAAVLADE